MPQRVCVGIPDTPLNRLRAEAYGNPGPRFPAPCHGCGAAVLIGDRVQALLGAGARLLCVDCLRRDYPDGVNLCHLGG